MQIPDCSDKKVIILKKLHGFNLINNLILILIALLCVYPFLYIFFIAVSDGTFLAKGQVSFLPKGFNLEAFKYVLTNPRFRVFVGLRNSFIYTILGTVIAMAMTYITAYVLSRPRFKHRYWLMSLFVITWVFEAGIIPQYIVYNAFGFVDNPAVMIIPGAISTQFLIIAKTFLDGIPKELEEAAFVDGANDWVIMTRIYMPLCTTLFATIGTFYAISTWNQYLLPQIYLKSENLQTIQQILKSVVITDSTSGTVFQNIFVNGVTLNQDNLKAAAVFTAMLPIVCIYPFVQKYFKKGILLGSVKG
jgi:putative aldouronate transport system permease protein